MYYIPPHRTRKPSPRITVKNKTNNKCVHLQKRTIYCVLMPLLCVTLFSRFSDQTPRNPVARLRFVYRLSTRTRYILYYNIIYIYVYEPARSLRVDNIYKTTSCEVHTYIDNASCIGAIF